MCVAGRNTQETGLHEWSVYQHHPHAEQEAGAVNIAAEQEAEAVNIAGNITNVLSKHAFC